MGRLTDTQLKAWLREAKASKTPRPGVADGDGLTFSISKAGVRGGFGLWGLRYRHGTRQCWLPIGRYPAISLVEARKRAQRERVRVADGVDVATERRRAKLALKTAKTFSELADEFTLNVVSLKADSTRETYELCLKNDIRKSIGKLKLEEVSSADVVAIVDRVGKRSRATACECFRVINAIYRYGIAKLACSSNPCAGLKPSAILGKGRPPRPRIALSEAELREILAELPILGPRIALAIKIILATCVRKGELIKARWTDLDLDAAVWHVPVELSKTRKAFNIPLPPVVVRWFAELRSHAAGSVWVVPGRNPRRHINLSSLNAALDRRLTCEARSFTPHDLRSTARSHLSRLGVDVIVAERCLNHTLGGMLAIYDHHDYLDERRAALEKWASFLEALETEAQTSKHPAAGTSGKDGAQAGR